MHSSRLRLLFARTLRASLLSPLVLSGCGIIEPPFGGHCGEPDQEPCPGVDLKGYAQPACNQNWLAVSGLSPALPPDVVQLRMLFPRRPPEEAAQPVLSASGTACATASNPSACQSELDQLKVTQGFRDRCGVEMECTAFYLATTRGDEVTAHTSLEALKRFLGPIDTTQEAALLAFGQGLDMACGKLESGAVKANPDGTFNVIGNEGHACGPGTNLYQVVMKVSPSGAVTEETRTLLEKGNPNCAIGRRPDGLHAAGSVDCDSALGRHFAQAAHLEAASIQAFLRLREELAQHGADESLRTAALASAVDEVMHTDVSTRLARRFGAEPPRPQVETRPPRSLFEVALENIVEGCTRETYGALVAHYQALHARDAEIRGIMARIAEDETRHAELSWAIDRWAHERLSDAERATLHEARHRAVETLREELARPLDAQLIDEAGLPPPEIAASMLASLERELWA
ncbi:ferritin-like domain-containing protein [Cystobacter ferrugineus]|uniref:Ferritin n=1 Tax=Cystobacter ferrugineus TaxID=83449 RepID=A0A1L9AZ83_9BACT|nr:ferritin-like domain-containing protein [Cystobacter ferrugineus]OJH35312.1 ferritin [Cystobacter ferrugineus]